MNDKARMALAVAAGYYLGRRRRLRWATALMAAGAAGRLRNSGGLVKQGTKLLSASPELEKVTDRLKGELVEVGKAAAVAATSRQLESLATRLHGRAEGLRTPAKAVTGMAGLDEEEEEEEYAEEPAEEEAREEEPKPRRAPRERTQARERVPKQSRTEQPRAKSGRSPVTRAGR